MIPFDFYERCLTAPDNNGVYENGYIVLIKPEAYYDNPHVITFMNRSNLELGVNALLFYETRSQWNNYHPDDKNLEIATSRANPLGGQYVARVPSTTANEDEKIIRGFNSSGSKGAGIRIYEYASNDIIKACHLQLEYLYWQCIDSVDVALATGMKMEDIMERKTVIHEMCDARFLSDNERLFQSRMIDKNGNTVCPLCLENLTANGFLNRLEQAEGRDVPDLTVTQVNLFHIRELKIGEFNHRPYNLGWGHHHCNIVCKDSGIIETLRWMHVVLERNMKAGVILN